MIKVYLKGSIFKPKCFFLCGVRFALATKSINQRTSILDYKQQICLVAR